MRRRQRSYGEIKREAEEREPERLKPLGRAIQRSQQRVERLRVRVRRGRTEAPNRIGRLAIVRVQPGHPLLHPQSACEAADCPAPRRGFSLLAAKPASRDALKLRQPGSARRRKVCDVRLRLKRPHARPRASCVPTPGHAGSRGAASARARPGGLRARPAGTPRAMRRRGRHAGTSRRDVRVG
jgi:hypothetical protein